MYAPALIQFSGEEGERSHWRISFLLLPVCLFPSVCVCVCVGKLYIYIYATPQHVCCFVHMCVCVCEVLVVGCDRDCCYSPSLSIPPALNPNAPPPHSSLICHRFNWDVKSALCVSAGISSMLLTLAHSLLFFFLSTIVPLYSVSPFFTLSPSDHSWFPCLQMSNLLKVLQIDVFSSGGTWVPCGFSEGSKDDPWYYYPSPRGSQAFSFHRPSPPAGTLTLEPHVPFWQTFAPVTLYHSVCEWK